MERFAKLYEYENIGQVLVVLDSEDESPVIIVRLIPGDGFGICDTKIQFTKYEDPEEAEKAADRAFDEFTEETAKKIAETMISTIANSMDKILTEVMEDQN